MKKARYDAIRIARELEYGSDVIARIQSATTESEIARILATARHNS